MGLSMAKVLQWVEECKHECKFYLENGKQFQAKHLNKWMRLAQERDDEEAFKKIGAIIQKEGQHSFWQGLNYVTGKKRTRSTTPVQVEEQSGLLLESTSKDTVEVAIFIGRSMISDTRWPKRHPYAVECSSMTLGMLQTLQHPGPS
jgi:hypothetical protein